MTKENLRDYNCKDEELTVISKYAAFSFRRDLPDFFGFFAQV